jgi:hypothetical protein
MWKIQRKENQKSLKNLTQPGCQTVAKLNLPPGSFCVDLLPWENKFICGFLIPGRGRIPYFVDPATGEAKEIVATP